MLGWAAMGSNAMTLRNYPLNELLCKSELQWASLGGIEESPYQKLPCKKEWYAMGCNGRTFEELSPSLKFPSKSELQQ